MHVQFTCTYWGQEGTDASRFFQRISEEQYDGVEINFPEDASFIKDFHKQLAARRSKGEFVFIGQQVLPPAKETVQAYIDRMKARLEFLVAQKPDFINSHTGKDHFSFDDN